MKNKKIDTSELMKQYKEALESGNFKMADVIINQILYLNGN